MRERPAIPTTPAAPVACQHGSALTRRSATRTSHAPAPYQQRVTPAHPVILKARPAAAGEHEHQAVTMTEMTFTGTVTIDGVPHQVTADLTATPVGTTTTTGTGGTTTTGTGGTTTTGTGGTTTTGTGTGTGTGGTTPPATAQCVFGIWDPATLNWNTPTGNPAGTWAGAAKFSAAPVKSVTYYSPWLEPLISDLVTLAASNGAKVYLNMEPWHTWGGGADPTMADIAKGTYDSYLTSIGNAIKAGGNEVWVTFAHEMNGTWYPWGIQAVTPAQWQAAWKHVVQVIRAAAGGYAKMVWCPNNNDVGPVSPYYPGDAYVDIAGFDGYVNQSGGTSQTYANFVKPTVSEIRGLTKLPIWNAETGIGTASNRAQQITQFVGDMQADGLIGFTWFNEGTIALSTAEIQALTTAVNAWNAA